MIKNKKRISDIDKKNFENISDSESDETFNF
jgi:hypothetical protein